MKARSTIATTAVVKKALQRRALLHLQKINSVLHKYVIKMLFILAFFILSDAPIHIS
jgi:hypothetical protein